MLFRRVLFPTDFSMYANTVFSCLPGLKRSGTHEIVLVHVIRGSDAPMPDTLNRESMPYVDWSVEEQLNIARMALAGEGLQVTTRVGYGNPASQIVQIAEEEKVHLIVIGARGTTLTEDLLIGSTTNEVVRRARVPVLVEKCDTVRELGRVRCRLTCEQLFSRVLHPTDFSPCADAAFQLVHRLRFAGTKEVVILHVQDERVMKHRPTEQIAEFDRIDTERLQAMGEALRPFNMEVQLLLRHGVPFRETLRVADEVNASMIVLGSIGRSALQELLTGSTLENVVRLSRQPVLVRPEIRSDVTATLSDK